MPIAGKTDKASTNPQRGLPTIAKVKKGAPKPESGKALQDLTYFRLAFKEEFAYLAPVFVQMYGDKPDKLENIFLLGDTPDQAFPTWLEQWANGTMLHKCSGEGTQERSFNRSTGTYETGATCLAPACECKQTGRLSFWIPEFTAKTNEFGAFFLETHSNKDISKLHNYLALIQSVMRLPLGKIPFILGRATEQVMAPDPKDKSRQIKTKKSLLYLKVMPSFMPEFQKAIAASANVKQIGTGGIGVNFDGEIEDEPIQRNHDIIEDDQHDPVSMNERDERDDPLLDYIDTTEKRTAFLSGLNKYKMKPAEAILKLQQAGFVDDQNTVQWAQIRTLQALSVLFPEEYETQWEEAAESLLADGEEVNF